MKLLVVITVLSVLAAGFMIFINPAKRFKQSNDARIKSDVNQISSALLSFYTLKMHYPTVADGGLNALVVNQDIKTLPVPPPGGAVSYSYVANASCNAFPYIGCEAILYYSLRDSSNVWCWQSKTSSVKELATCPAP